MDDEIIGTDGASGITGASKGTLRYWRHAGIGPASFRLQGRVVYRRSEIERWIAEQEAATKRGGGDAA